MSQYKKTKYVIKIGILKGEIKTLNRECDTNMSQVFRIMYTMEHLQVDMRTSVENTHCQFCKDWGQVKRWTTGPAHSRFMHP